MLKLYSGNREVVRLVQYCDVIKLNQTFDVIPMPGMYAIPGGKRATEDEVRKWASAEGFTVRKCY